MGKLSDRIATLEDRLRELETRQQRMEARKGPIADFLRYYKDHDKATQVQNWADEVDRDLCELGRFLAGLDVVAAPGPGAYIPLRREHEIVVTPLCEVPLLPDAPVHQRNLLPRKLR